MMMMMIAKASLMWMRMMMMEHMSGPVAKLVFVVFRIGPAHVYTHTLDDVTLAAQRTSDVRLDERDEAERTERLWYVHIDDLTELGEVLLKVMGRY